MARTAVALLLLALAAGCGSGERKRSAEPGPRVIAPTQDAPLLAAVRVRFGNPPRLALVTLHGDGTAFEVRLEAPTGEIQRIGAPAWSPDGSKIYFVGSGKERHGKDYVYYPSDAFVIDAASGSPKQLTTTRDVQSVLPSPDGERLVVARLDAPGTFPGSSSLWLTGADGRHARRLFDPKEGRLDFPGSWSPDGRTLAFTRCTYGIPDQQGLVPNTCGVFTTSFDGREVRKLAGRSRSPSYSPDGRRIAFVSDRDQSGKFRTGEDEDAFASELYVMNADGTDQQRLTSTDALDEGGPVWTPDGSRIAYSREGPSSFIRQLMTVAPNGTCEQVVIGDGSQHGEELLSFETPAWRPGRVTGSAPESCPRR